ncbi:hypothetical protein CEXT_538051 [Caerostris extrusa]|uniref:Uncharacterized protein n=1 Tax=Caerostris extrusa TaxID=172846 RepID=A0AAV4XLA3_CAEEX|nr:hypothetical protein CEXT_538051 [Caerostris extrusa]
MYKAQKKKWLAAKKGKKESKRKEKKKEKKKKKGVLRQLHFRLVSTPSKQDVCLISEHSSLRDSNISHKLLFTIHSGHPATNEKVFPPKIIELKYHV